jgi:hypothetical protein
MAARLAFVLNFDAELELERGRRYAPTRAMTERVHALARAMRASLPADAAVLDPFAEAAPPGCVPVAWCPTSRALAVIARAGLAAPAAPSTDVLTRVNERGFAHALADDTLLSVRAGTPDEALAVLERPGAWLLKRGLGFSGRGQRPVTGGAVTDADRAFVRASFAGGRSLYVEQRASIVRELSVYAWALGQRVDLRSIRTQDVDAQGAFLATRHAEHVEASVRDALERTTVRVGDALRAAGYLGPFGIDAYIHRVDGRLELRALSEINARFCMGWDAHDGWLPPDAQV